METEKRLIDANALVDELKWLQSQVSNANAIEIQEYIDRINRQPTVDAVEVVHGRWENQHGIYSCSVCGKSNPYEVLGDNIWYWPCNYCPNCGAKMDGDGNG